MDFSRKGPGRPPKAQPQELPPEPVKLEEEMIAVKIQPSESIAEKIIDKSAKVLAKTVQLGIGVDMLGSAMSLNNSRGNILEVTPLGVRAVSKKNGRVVLLPWANIRGVELVK
jgi:hypothetical protein